MKSVKNRKAGTLNTWFGKNSRTFCNSSFTCFMNDFLSLYGLKKLSSFYSSRCEGVGNQGTNFGRWERKRHIFKWTERRSSSN